MGVRSCAPFLLIAFATRPLLLTNAGEAYRLATRTGPLSIDFDPSPTRK